jgi:exodeoxyribonuclease VII large subunit
MRNVFSVSRINAYIRRMFSEDYLLRNVQVRGEVSNCKYHASGHIYFTLKDASGTLSCVMFAGRRRGLSFPMQNGDQVVAAGSIEVYERAGSYQLYASHIVRDGVGELAERFEMLKKKLLEQGMFDESYKRPLPRYIRTLGVVTASTGAAVRDIVQISKRRNPYISIILYPAIVQGDAAPDSIVRGIRTLDQYGVDVIIIGRGGGSLEDLWAFNEERVAEAVFNCMTPVISAVGHETDTVITDFVADLRAPTPSAAAELAVFDLFQYDGDLASYRRRLEDSLYKKIMLRRTELTRMQRELHHLSPDVRIRDQRMSADRAWEQLDLLMKNKI